VCSSDLYYCYCSSARLERIRKIQEANKLAPGYDRNCRNLTNEELESLKAEGIKPVVRLKVPLEGSVTVHDELLGDITTEMKDISPDPVLLKSDGFPTYHLANIIDDHFMEISHIMRAQEWLPSAPMHKVLYEAFGWQMPRICHLPMVMGNDGFKLSKRHGATAVKDFIAKGYLSEAVINYISLLGWSFDDSREFFSFKELCEVFSLQKMSKSPAVFDYKKLDWFNGQYIRKLTDEELLTRLTPFLQADGLLSKELKEEEKAFLLKTMPLIKERIQHLTDAAALLKFFFEEPATYNIEDAIPKKMDLNSATEALKMARELMVGYGSRSTEKNEELFRAKAEEAGLKINQLLQGLRVAVSGSTVSPPLFDSISLLGDDKVIKRVDKLLALMKTGKN
jgi:glutamyl-tRNA synthetase